MALASNLAPAPPPSRRSLDIFYLTYFILLIPITLCIDLQHMYPADLVPQVLKNVRAWHIAASGDPFLARTLGGAVEMAWFDVFVWLEAGYQVPTFFLCVWGLLKQHASVYILLLAYGASTATTILPCISTILTIPTSPHQPGKYGPLTLTLEQKRTMLFAYAPFLVITLVMAIDSGFKLRALIKEVDDQKVRRRVTKAVMSGKKAE